MARYGQRAQLNLTISFLYRKANRNNSLISEDMENLIPSVSGALEKALQLSLILAVLDRA